jgi:magnesium chelatase subunit D
MKLTGLDDAHLALMLCAIEPKLSGVLLVGQSGVGKSSLLAQLAQWYDGAIVKIPLGVEEEHLVGSLCFEEIINGTTKSEEGLLSQAQGGMVISENCTLQPEHIMHHLFNANYQFSLLCTHHMDNPPLSDHLLDRIDLCVELPTQKNLNTRQEIVQNSFTCKEDMLMSLHQQSMQKAQKTLQRISYNQEMLSLCIQLASECNTHGHRAERALFLAARAYVALMGDTKIEESHIRKVAPLCLIHRQKELPPPPPEEESQYNDSNEAMFEHDESSSQTEEATASSMPKESDSSSSTSQEGSGKEEIIRAQEPLKLKPFWLTKDQKVRKGLGLRTATKTSVKRGRTIRTLSKEGDDISLASTIRAAAPWQRVRGRKEGECLAIEASDIQIKQREAKSSYTVIMLVDASGSMGAKARIKQAKEACLGILKDAYTKREDVAVIAFKSNDAQLIVAPTRAKSIVKEQLDAIPVGGKTPLSAALRELYLLSQNITKKDPQRRILAVILSDAKANVSSDTTYKPWEEVTQWATLLATKPAISSIVVDTETKGLISFGKAKELALLLNAQYYDLEALGEQGVSGIFN